MEKRQLSEELELQKKILQDEQNQNYTESLIRQQKHNQVLEEL